MLILLWKSGALLFSSISNYMQLSFLSNITLHCSQKTWALKQAGFFVVLYVISSSFLSPCIPLHCFLSYKSFCFLACQNFNQILISGSPHASWSFSCYVRALLLVCTQAWITHCLLPTPWCLPLLNLWLKYQIVILY